MDTGKLLDECVRIAREAGDAVMEIYNSGDFQVETKEDNTPLTRADKAANQIIEAGLKKISDFPIMSEEGNHKIDSEVFWCVDPIDGTSDFIKRNGEFTINVGLIKNNEPILGVVYAPARDLLYYGASGLGAFKQVGGEDAQKIEAKFQGPVPIVAVSRSHQSAGVESFLYNLGDYELYRAGSSLKFCLVAEGKATIYPRPEETHMKIWDAAAADAVLRAAGSAVCSVKTNKPIAYDPADIVLPPFVTSATGQAYSRPG